jgi:hypothetical protein
MIFFPAIVVVVWRKYRRKLQRKEMVLEEIGSSKTSAAGRLKHNSHLAGSGKDRRL